MGNYADKLQKRAGDFMKPDEKLLAAIRTLPRGGTTGLAVGGLIGQAVAGRQAKKAQEGATEGSLARSWPQGQQAVGLTDQRLLTFNYTAMGKPKDLTGEFPLDQVASVELNKKKIANGVKLAFNDGSAIEIEVKKLEKIDDFISAFNSVKGKG